MVSVGMVSVGVVGSVGIFSVGFFSIGVSSGTALQNSVLCPDISHGLLQFFSIGVFSLGHVALGVYAYGAYSRWMQGGEGWSDGAKVSFLRATQPLLAADDDDADDDGRVGCSQGLSLCSDTLSMPCKCLLHMPCRQRERVDGEGERGVRATV